MTHYVALLRAVNVGGTGKLPMAELRAMCESLGFANVRTYIASGNVVFSSKLSETAVKKKLESGDYESATAEDDANDTAPKKEAADHADTEMGGTDDVKVKTTDEEQLYPVLRHVEENA